MMTLYVNKKGKIFIQPSHYLPYHGWTKVMSFDITGVIHYA